MELFSRRSCTRSLGLISILDFIFIFSFPRAHYANPVGALCQKWAAFSLFGPPIMSSLAQARYARRVGAATLRHSSHTVHTARRRLCSPAARGPLVEQRLSLTLSAGATRVPPRRPNGFPAARLHQRTSGGPTSVCASDVTHRARARARVKPAGSRVAPSGRHGFAASKGG